MQDFKRQILRRQEIRADFRDAYDKYVQSRPKRYNEGTDGFSILEAVTEFRKDPRNHGKAMFSREAWELISGAHYMTEEELLRQRELIKIEERRRTAESIRDKCCGMNHKDEIVRQAMRLLMIEPDTDHWNAVNIATAQVKKRLGES